MTGVRRGKFVAWLAAAVIPLLAIARCAPAQRIADLPPQKPATTTKAADKDAPPASLVLTASIASLDAVSSFTKDIGPGADLPLLSGDFIEQQLPFVGPGGLAHDRPLGVLFYLTSDLDLDLERSLTFVLPVNPGKAELKTFTDKGAAFVAGRNDLVTLEGVGFRRTKDQFIFGQIAGAVAAVREDVLTSTYAGSPNVLARVDLDAAALRTAIPERYAAFVDDLDNNVDANNPAARAGAELVQRSLRAITRVGLSVARNSKDGGARLAVRVEPSPSSNGLAPATTVKRPGFPEGSTFFRADFACPPAKALGHVTDVIKATVEGDAQFAKLSPRQQDRARALASSFTAFLLAGESGSLAAESSADGQIIGHWVTQRPGAPIDLERDMRALVQQATELARSTKDVKPAASYENYATQPSGTTVHRLVLAQDGKPSLYVDAVARDSTVFMSIAQTPGKFVERLLSLQPTGETAAFASGWLDLGALTALGVAPTVKGKVDVKGQRLTWTATREQGALRVDVDVPKSLLQQLPKLVQQLQ